MWPKQLLQNLLCPSNKIAGPVSQAKKKCSIAFEINSPLKPFKLIKVKHQALL